MDKQYLINIAKARKSINIWFSNLEQINRNIEMIFDDQGLDKNNTDFGRWYYGEGQIFSSFESFRAIEAEYNLMYDLFLNYNRVYQTPVKKSIFSRKIDKQKEELTKIFNQIETQKNNLYDYVSFFEEHLRNSPLFSVNDQTPENLSDIEIIIEKKSKEKQQENIEQQSVKDLKTTDNELDVSEVYINNEAQKKTESDTHLFDLDIEEEIRRILN